MIFAPVTAQALFLVDVDDSGGDVLCRCGQSGKSISKPRGFFFVALPCLDPDLKCVPAICGAARRLIQPAQGVNLVNMKTNTANYCTLISFKCVSF